MYQSARVGAVKAKLIAAIVALANRDPEQGAISDTADKMVTNLRIEELIDVSQREVEDEAVEIISSLAKSNLRLLDEQEVLIDAGTALARGYDALVDTNQRLLVGAASVLAAASTVRFDNELLRNRVAELEGSSRLKWFSGETTPEDGSLFVGLWMKNSNAPDEVDVVATAFYDENIDAFVDDIGTVQRPEFWMPMDALPRPTTL